jgi:hypothetical protein
VLLLLLLLLADTGVANLIRSKLSNSLLACFCCLLSGRENVANMNSRL